MILLGDNLMHHSTTKDLSLVVTTGTIASLVPVAPSTRIISGSRYGDTVIKNKIVEISTKIKRGDEMKTETIEEVETVEIAIDPSQEIEPITKNHQETLKRLINTKGEIAGAEYIESLLDKHTFSETDTKRLIKKYDSLFDSIAKKTEPKPEPKPRKIYDAFSQKMKGNIKALQSGDSPKNTRDYISLLLDTYQFSKKVEADLKKTLDILDTEISTLQDVEKLRKREDAVLGRNTAAKTGEIHHDEMEPLKTADSAKVFIAGLQADFDLVDSLRSNEPDVLKQTYHFYAEKWYKLPEYGGDSATKEKSWTIKTFNLKAKMGKDNHGNQIEVRSLEDTYTVFRQMVLNRRRKGAALLGFPSTSKKKNDEYLEIARKEGSSMDGEDLPLAPKKPKRDPFEVVIDKLVGGKYEMTTAQAYKAISYLKTYVRDAGLANSVQKDFKAWEILLEEMEVKK